MSLLQDSFVNMHQVAEVDSLKHRLKQYSDYDEIKRELGVMKVGFCLTRVFSILH